MIFVFLTRFGFHPSLEVNYQYGVENLTFTYDVRQGNVGKKHPESEIPHTKLNP